MTQESQLTLDLERDIGLGLDLMKYATEEMPVPTRGDITLADDYIIIDRPGPKTPLQGMVDKVFGDIEKSSAGKQLAIGGAAGWASGFLLIKVGKIAGLSVAGSVLLIQVAQYNGLVKVDWTKVKHVMTRAELAARKRIEMHKKTFAGKAKTFFEENFFLASGFTGGLLIGLLM